MALNVNLSHAVGRLDYAINVASEKNDKKRILEENIEKMSDIKQDLDDYVEIYTDLIKILQGKAAQYREVRKSALEEMTTTVLKSAFPNEEYNIKIDGGSNGQNPTAQILNTVKTKDGSVEYYPPSHINGELAKQVIAFTTLCVMCSMDNAKFIGYDECLNSGDDDSLIDLKPLFDKLSSIFQIVMIEHKKSLYENLDRKEIYIDKVGGDGEPLSGETKVVSEREVINNG